MGNTDTIRDIENNIREISARWAIWGELSLTSAIHLGRGDGDIVDMELIHDKISGYPLLTGATQAGALRSYLLDCLKGYRVEEEKGSKVSQLFGGTRCDDQGGQSPLIVYDSIGAFSEAEIRDGVRLDSKTGLADNKAKYDFEVWPKGTIFPLRFDLLISKKEKEDELLRLLCLALAGLENGEILLGAKKSRGLGACRVIKWRAMRYDLTIAKGWLNWLKSPVSPLHLLYAPDHLEIKNAIKHLYPSFTKPTIEDKRSSFKAEVELNLQGGILIRSAGTRVDDPDHSHLTSAGEPIISGTSLAGAMRARALRITKLFKKEDLVEKLFGPKSQHLKNPYASRLIVSESVIQDSKPIRLNRVKIDRFTGGTVDGALFDEQPAYGGTAKVTFTIIEPKDEEIGLILLLIKDLITGDMTVGGTSGVGRGVFKGEFKELVLNKESFDPTIPEGRKILNEFVTAFSSKGGN